MEIYIFEETDMDRKEGKLGSMVCNVAAGTLVVVYLPALGFAVSHSYSLLSNCNPEISIFYDLKFSRYFRPLSSYLQNPIHALAISGVIRSFKSTLASTNNSFALFKLQNSSSLFPKTEDSSAFTMVFIIVDATI